MNTTLFRSQRSFWFIVSCTMMIALLSACGGQSSATKTAPKKVSDVTITVRDDFFDPDTVAVTPNQSMNLTFVNKGNTVHLIEVQGLTGDITLQPGDTITTLVKPLARSYNMVDELHYKSGMAGTLIGGTMTTRASTSVDNVTTKQMVAYYLSYVDEQADLLIKQTKLFTAAVKKGDLNQAKTLYEPAHQYYEMIEPIAEQFGDLDASIDARANDVPANQWQGFHVIEKSLWVQNTTKNMGPVADKLMSDVNSLRKKVDTVTLTPEGIVDGAVGLLDEASKSKITGEEERYSHTDLADLMANVEGSQSAFQVFKTYLSTKNPALLQEITTKFQQVEQNMAPFQTGKDTYVTYTSLAPADVHKISESINAVAEPLSQVAVQLPKA